MSIDVREYLKPHVGLSLEERLDLVRMPEVKS